MWSGKDLKDFNAVCVFFQGPGLIVSDDDTALHGEFSDDWVVNGKVRIICLFYSLLWAVSVSLCPLD